LITNAMYGVEPWELTETSLDLDLIAQSESVFALSNGHIGLRGNLDEGEPHGLPGTYLNSLYEERPLPYAEAGYGYPQTGQTVINVTNGKIIRLLVNDEPFDIRYGTLHSHTRTLDLRAGTLTREAEWTSPAGNTVRVRSVRLVSLTQRAIAAFSYTVTPVGDGPLRLVVLSEIVANEEVPAQGGDPRTASALASPLVGEEHFAANDVNPRAVLVHGTRASKLRMAAGMVHQVTGPEKMTTAAESFEDMARFTVAAEVAPGEELRLVKYVGYGWSSQRSRPALVDQVAGALAAARLTGWDGLIAEQRKYLDEFWEGADVEVDGDVEIQQAVRFSLFHILQAGARAEFRPIPAKGLTGAGYDGHTFWDTETFVLPVLTYTMPSAAASALRWRHSVLKEAKAHAREFGLSGAAFPWRTIQGQECSGYWPAGTAAFHINAAIAHAVMRYIEANEDEAFEKEVALPLLVETARLWRSLGQHDSTGKFRIDGVTGPDEYSAVKDNNVYTNLMAQYNLACAAELAVRLPEHARELGVTTEETASWRDAAADMYIPYDSRLGVHPQHEGFTDYARWDFAGTAADRYPLLLHYPYFQLYRSQVVKQADVVLAMQFRGDAFTPEQKLRNFDYYEALTVRDSSLSASTQAVMAAEVGHLGLAYDYLAEAALLDLQDREHNTRDGLHMASLAGAWMALVGGFGGMRCNDAQLSFAPRLPPGIVRLSFRMRFQGRIVHVETQSGKAMYTLLAGGPLPITHHGKEVTLTSETVAMEIPSIEPLPEPMQPVGRVPQSRRNRPLYPERIAPPRPVARRLLCSAALAIGTGARRALSPTPGSGLRDRERLPAIFAGNSPRSWIAYPCPAAGDHRRPGSRARAPGLSPGR
jgi:alpha,alpha-trehalose phosphorylase